VKQQLRKLAITGATTLLQVPGATTFALLLFAVLLLGLAPSTPVHADSQPNTSSTFMLASPPVVISNGSVPALVVTYMNEGSIPVNGTVYVDVQNYLGETVYVTFSSTQLTNPGLTMTATILLPLPLDAYTVNFFVVENAAIVLSTTNSTSIIA